MARILVMSSKEKGHVNPLIGMVQHLLDRGHTVGWVCLPSPSPQVEALGVEAMTLPGMSEPDNFVTSGPELAAIVRDPERLFPWIRALLVDQVPALISPTRAHLQSWKAELLVVDPMMYHGHIAAKKEDIPYVCLSSSLNPIIPDDLECILTRQIDSLHPDRVALFKAHGMAPTFKVSDALSPFANGVFTTRAYIGDVNIPPNTHLLGPTIPPNDRGDEPDFPWHRLDGRPMIYASFGSQIYHQPEVFELLARATAGLDVQLVISCGALAKSTWASSLPAHAITVSYAPQLKLLSSASAFVTHGGANSAMEALWAGVPTLMSPVCNDQPLQAHFVTSRGTGIALDLYAASREEVEAALATLIAPENRHRRATNQVKANFMLHDGAMAAADLVETQLR